MSALLYQVGVTAQEMRGGPSAYSTRNFELTVNYKVT
jgi:hypothetical protein